jgi:hypothetical protein
MSIDSGDKESIDIILMDDLSVYNRVKEVKKKLSEWNGKLKVPFDPDVDQLRLSRFEKRGRKYFYRYTINRGANELKRKL